MSEDKKSDPLHDFIAAIFVAIVIMALIYFYYIDVWYFFRKWSFYLLSLVPENIRGWIFFYAKESSSFVELMYEDLIFHSNVFADYYKNSDIGLRKKAQIDAVARTLFYPYVFVACLFLIVKELTKKFGKITKPGKRYAMYNYARTQMEIWPFIKPVAPIMEKIVKNDDLDSGPNAAPKIPLMWMIENNLMNEVKPKKERDLFTVSQRVKFTLDRPRAYQALVKNLGRPWVGVEDLNFNERCLFSVLVPHIYGRVKESRLNNREILNHYGMAMIEKDKRKIEKSLEALTTRVNNVVEKYAESFRTPYFELESFDDPYDPIISSFQTLDTEKDMFIKGDRLIRDTLLTHRYVKTVFFSLMEKSWTYGVLSSAELLWLKSLDRDLFYVASQQGRNSSFVEVAGCWSHYLSESSLGFKMLSPQVFNAIRALDYDLYDTHNNYIPHEEWSDNSRWDKLVPDAMQSSAALPKGPQGGASALF